MARLLPLDYLPACPGCGIALWTPGLCPVCKQDYFQNMQRQDWAEEIELETEQTTPTKGQNHGNK